MTAKEKLLERVASWSEEQAELALRAVEGADVDAWGDLSTLHRTTTSDVMARLARQERYAGSEPW
ncbi:MAG: hypothetical protein AB7G37_15185 [Solirubrobacteraceae bacterium]